MALNKDSVRTGRVLPESSEGHARAAEQHWAIAGQGVYSRRRSLAGWLSWLGHLPVHQKVTGSIPGQGMFGRQPMDASLSQKCFSLSLPLPSSLSKINENMSLGEG